MFEEAISRQTAKNLEILGKSKILKNAYLAGGTALALQMGHRVSYDLDFFTDKKFKAQIFLKKISQIKSYRHERIDWGTILGKLGDVKFSIFYYDYPLLKKPIQFKDIKVASIHDIAAMKIAAVSERGTKRDFIDLYFILQKFTLSEILNFYNHKYKKLSSNLIHIKKSIVYFVDAEEDEMPNMLKQVSWKEVKKFFEKEIKSLSI
ncbi:nucleotidyl transferase AbiEii/AbiGii toxin family protein [Patescibacteria group bacterium]|nr:nucleotidyl transferase AbiEii/AbiGii toxin family protein [Patescibacteria group bacterium]MBU2263681.1 nucleotidyl transferase AbiEii/AbiGii toxin family protein [Patescibacteria group bacterium]